MLGMSLYELFLASPTMVVLLVCSIITIGFAVERSLFFHSTRTNAAKFMKGLSPLMQKGDTRSALRWCKDSNSSVGRVISQGLTHASLKRDELLQRMETAIEVEQVEMERNLSVLGTMSNIAPLLGLFGTVIGIIRAFADIATAGAGGSAVVAMGVSEALMTTAAGIVVAVIATIFFNVFVRRIRTRTVELEDAREEFFNLLNTTKQTRSFSNETTAQQKTVTETVDSTVEACAKITKEVEEPVTSGA
ncbi:MotA/TolQ/ExbB proton channel family protein [bacterium]|jgi:biopolymer transport protein ExbB|nr:MotA/TolQ/ExbB proton channel family protein [bacterium]